MEKTKIVYTGSMYEEPVLTKKYWKGNFVKNRETNYYKENSMMNILKLKLLIDI